MKLKKFKHFLLKNAEKEIVMGNKTLYKVTTINWTFATEKGRKKDYKKVHKNIYVTDLLNLIKWIRETEEVAEDIIKIELLIV